MPALRSTLRGFISLFVYLLCRLHVLLYGCEFQMLMVEMHFHRVDHKNNDINGEQ